MGEVNPRILHLSLKLEFLGGVLEMRKHGRVSVEVSQIQGMCWCAVKCTLENQNVSIPYSTRVQGSRLVKQSDLECLKMNQRLGN